MPAYPLDLPKSFRILSGDQDMVMDNIVVAKDARGQTQARNLGGGRWKGSFNLTPMSPNEAMYEDWRSFTSQLRQSFGTFKMPPFDILTGQRYKTPECFCYIFETEAGVNELFFYDLYTVNEFGAIVPPELRWFTLDDNLYEIISLRPTPGSLSGDLTTIINPPLITPILEDIFNDISDTAAYCIARATTITQPTITKDGMYSGARIQWTQVIKK